MRLTLVTLLFIAPLLSADIIDQVTLDTAPLIGSSSGPFTLDFQFIEGNGIGDLNNTVTLSNFLFGGGSIATPPSSTTGGVSVTSSPFSVSLNESSFYDDVEFSFTPGSTLNFQVDATTNLDAVAPDSFTFAILDNSLNPIPTTNPNGFNTLLEIDLPSTISGTQTMSSSTDLTQTAIDIAAPTVTPQISGVPEPSSLPLLATVLLGGLYFHRRVSKRRI